MAHTFDDDALAGVLGHMNDDHSDDNLLIARAFAPLTEVIGSEMIGFDGAAGRWRVRLADGTEDVIVVPWPGGAITERREVRREIVALYDEACARLGITPRPHS
ncbi:DUF2470 domain-containing protein [Microbacterium hominis]|uniref:DUF2470 domain-containing protein n=1 Tax=Microbacterium TaxID=33882 RepID=UPI00168BB20E|nr:MULTISPECIES: DUF2470 domain-containing protein [Microbacterium]QOC27018.1 DUF2470 domain-containing protein [Microbacterium hominis]QOC28180.1 DUF2470 domain-containing protein [Microbacterium hominis]QYF96647.1 DUF2470 domain-containing protein [Microbacterium sp. PAMC21962]